MKQKLIALAIASALSAPAFADNANVTVYGKAFLTMDSHDTGVAGTVSKMRVNTNASRFGVKGDEDLGDDLKALYQFEVEVDADGSTGAGMGKTRNSGAGLEGGFGKIVLGYWDTPFKVAHNAIELFDNTTDWTATKVIGVSEGKNFNTRQKNMVQYWTPKMGGLQASFMYTPDEAKTTTSNKSNFSMAATFKQDAIYAAAAYESRPDQTTNGTTDSAFRLVGKYDLADAWVGAMLENIKTNTSTTASVSGKNVELVGGINMGASSIAASYAKAGSTATGATAANDVNQLALKYAYKFSKRTEVFAAYASKKTNGATSVTAKTFGGGLVHAF
ncbi:MAG: porin [Gammaproteobacteria bacterium]|nr:porin [Sideroxydans sp.]MBU3902927.1 porin [Gammaproteobacteria bacterium]MBU4046765.1 porin [Gammaproteobacteria bacterium]MBU4150994.1 porin [Gammaproteobacteria bacterium]